MVTYSYDYFSNTDNGYTDKHIVFISKVEDIETAIKEHNIEPGELMYFCKDINGDIVPTHATIIVDQTETKLSSNDIIYAAHTSNKINGKLSDALDTGRYAGVQIVLMKRQ